MLKIGKGYNFKTIIVILLTVMLFDITLYASQSCLRVPAKNIKRLQTALELTSEGTIVRLLSSDEATGAEKDNALIELDKIDTPDKIVSIVEEIFANRGLSLNIDITGDPDCAVQIRDMKNGDIVGHRDFRVASEENKLTFHSTHIYKTELHGKRLLPLLYRWMSAHPYFRSRFPGWNIEMEYSNYGAARSFWRSGFKDIHIRHRFSEREINHIDEIQLGEWSGYYICYGKFPVWKDLQKVISTLETLIYVNQSLLQTYI